jgi:hypothetical protein
MGIPEPPCRNGLLTLRPATIYLRVGFRTRFDFIRSPTLESNPSADLAAGMAGDGEAAPMKTSHFGAKR